MTSLIEAIKFETVALLFHFLTIEWKTFCTIFPALKERKLKDAKERWETHIHLAKQQQSKKLNPVF